MGVWSIAVVHVAGAMPATVSSITQEPCPTHLVIPNAEETMPTTLVTSNIHVDAYTCISDLITEPAANNTPSTASKILVVLPGYVHVQMLPTVLC